MKRLMLVFLFFFSLTCLVLAGTQVSTVLDGTTIPARQAVSSADIAALDSTNLILTLIPTNNHPTITLSPTLSTSAATCRLTLARGMKDVNTGVFTPTSFQSTTFAASASYTIGGRYIAYSADYSTAGYQWVEVIVETISAGNVTVEVNIH